MCLKPLPPESHSIPEETAHAARTAFPRGNPYMRLRDELGELYSDPAFAALFPGRGQPAESPGRLALVTVLQFMENLTDRQAADAVRARIDWKYALGLPLTDAGFHYSVLSEFRARLLAGGAEQQLLDLVLGALKARGLVKARGRQRTDSTHVLAAIRVLNRLECVGETLRQALNALALAEPDWLRAWVPPVWFERYERRMEAYRLPTQRDERYHLAEQIGADGFRLLEALYDWANAAATSATSATPVTLSAAQARALWESAPVQVLYRVWLQQFQRQDDQVTWRAAEDLPPGALLISSPYDVEARYSRKRDTEWTGYKVHLTETCDDDLPHLLTDVQTTPAATPDAGLLPDIQAALDERELVPAEHLVDAGYVCADHFVTSQTTYGTALIAPAPPDTSWQARESPGFAIPQFAIDWDAQTVTCPQGHASVAWKPGRDHHTQAVITVRFDPAACQACPVRAQCTHAPARVLVIRPQPQFEALQAARARETTPEFQAQYAARAGVEGTIAQAVRSYDVRQARYIGLAKTHLQHLATAVATNLARVAAWLEEVPRAITRVSAFAALAPA